MSNEQGSPDAESTGPGLDFETEQPTPINAEATVTEVSVEEVPVVEEPVAAPSDGAGSTDEAQVGVDEDSAEETDAVAEGEMVAIFLRQGINPNAEMSKDPTHPLNPKREWRDGEELYVVPCTSVEFNNLLTNARRIDPTNSEQGRAWSRAVALGREFMPRADTGLGALTRKESLWRQSVRSGGEGSAEIAAGRPRPSDRKGDLPLVGEEAMLYMQTMLGTGQVTRIPLYHSGLWLNLKAPTESQLLQLDRRIANEKIYLGRATNGLAYSNMSVYHNSFLFNFALSMVFDCSVSNYTLDTLKQRILLTDLPSLLWGLLCTIYPNGYRYHRPCINDPSVCTHVTEELLDISKLSWTDNQALTSSQRTHMVRKTAKFPDVELANYISQHRYNDKGTVVLKDLNGNKTVVELRVPTLTDYEASGFSWVEGIVSETDQAFGSQLDGDARNTYILEQAQATSLRQYAHWIKRIVFNTPERQSVIEDRSTLESMIGQLTGDLDVFNKFLEGVRAFIDETTISQIAIPSYNCPVCQKDQNDPEERKHPHLIPLDMGTIFFTLLGQRTSLLLDTAVI